MKLQKRISLLFVFCALLISLVGCVSKITVTFDTDGGSAIPSMQVNVGDKINLPANPVKEGFVFDGWLLDGKPFDPETKPKTDITLKASWKKENPEKYSVKFMVDGEVFLEEEYLEDSLVARPKTNPTKEGFTFKGWFLNGQLFDFDKTKVSSNLVLVAEFEPDNTQTERIIVYAVSMPEALVLFEENRSEKQNKRTEFMDLTKRYVVGDDNAWMMKPSVTFLKEDLETGNVEETVVSEWVYEVRVYLFKDGAYQLLANDSEMLDAVDNKNCTVDFSDAAIGESFKVEVVPTGLTEKQLQNASEYTISFEFDVIDGYNIYNAKELAYIENRTSGTEADAWKAFKEANSLDCDFHPVNLVFHKNLDVTANDVPGYFFYTAEELNPSDSDYDRALGSMKDWNNFYFREVKGNEEFNILGNYFRLSTQALKEVVREDNKITNKGEVISHATLFRFEGDETANTSIQNLNVIGNAPRVENTVKSGGQIFLKVEGPKFTAYNNITICLFITYMPNYTNASFLMNKCRAYDSYNCFVYNWGSQDVTIKDCEMIGAGGPVIIQDHVGPTDADGGRPSKTVADNSKLESYVTGQEGWFSVVGASAIVPAIKAMNALFEPFGRSFIKTNPSDGNVTYINLVCVNKSGNGEGLTAEKIEGTFEVTGKNAFNYGLNNPILRAVLEQTFVNGAPTFQTSAGGFGYTDGKTGIFDHTNTQIVDPTNAIYQGEYLCLYYNGMAIVLGFYNTGETYNPLA